MKDYDYYLQDFGIHNPLRPLSTWDKARSKNKRKAEVLENTNAQQELKQMTSLKDSAKEYTTPETKNIADLEIVSVSAEIENKEVTKEDGTTFSYNFIKVNNVEHRVPNIVLKQLKEHIEANPKLENFKVSKKGTGLATTYTLIPVN